MRITFLTLAFVAAILATGFSSFAQDVATPIATAGQLVLVKATGVEWVDKLVLANLAYIAIALSIIVGANKLALLTPTEWDNRIMSIVMTGLYYILAIIGLKFPDIQKPSELLGKKE